MSVAITELGGVTVRASEAGGLPTVLRIPDQQNAQEVETPPQQPESNEESGE